MLSTVHKVVVGVCVLAIVGSLVAFFATGMYPYTRFRDKEIEEANAQSELSDLFAAEGAESEPVEQIESVNAIGLLPSGPGLASLSVVTVSVPALGVIGLTWWLGRRAARRSAPAGVSGGGPTEAPSEAASAAQPQREGDSQ